MKKFLYTVVLLAGFQLAQAQQVTDINWVTAIADQTVYTYPLQGYTFDLAQLTQGSVIAPDTTTGKEYLLFLLLVDVKNTQFDSIAVGDQFLITAKCNSESLTNLQAIVISANTILPGDTGYVLSSQVQIPLSSLKTGIGGNYFCLQTTTAYPGGTPTPVTTSEFCVYFTTTNIPTSIATIDLLKEATIYPNPVNDRLQINNLQETTHIELYSITGQLLQTVPTAMGNVDIDLSSFANGMYILKMQNGKNIRTEKIQVVK